MNRSKKKRLLRQARPSPLTTPMVTAPKARPTRTPTYWLAPDKAIVDVDGDFESECLRLLFLRGLRAPRRTHPLQSYAGHALASIFDHEERIPARRRRRVQRSTRFDLEFPALSAELRAGVHSLFADVEAGNDLRPYLSTLVARPSPPDGLLNDWSVHHFHLGAPVMCSDGFVSRTGRLLFALLSERLFRVVGIFDHDSFADTEVLETIRRNWPALIERGTLGLASRFGNNPTPAEIRAARAAGVTPLITLASGDVIVGPGGGVTTSGHSVRAAERVDGVFADVHVLWRLIVRDVDLVIDEVARRTSTARQRLVLSLQLAETLAPSFFEHRARLRITQDGDALRFQAGAG